MADSAPRQHLPSPELIERWPSFTAEKPLKMLVSGCLAGFPVGVDGSTYGPHDQVQSLMALPNVSAVSFCPENFAFGTPRSTPDIHGGDGFDVLDGRARVLAATGEDWTAGMIAAAEEMLHVAKTNSVRLALLMDISAACGSQVIYSGERTTSPHRVGRGVAAALLIRNGFPVVSQRDYKTLNLIAWKLGVYAPPSAPLIDHHETDWYRRQFGN